MWQPRWLLLSYLLAAFTLVTVVINLLYTHHLMQRYHTAVEVDQEWAERLERYVELSQLATRLNTSVQTLFVSEDLEVEAARMHMFLRLFNTYIAARREEMQTNVSPARAASLLEDLTVIHNVVTAMADAADLIYAALRQHQPSRAQQQLTRSNRLYADVRTAFATLLKDVRVVQQALFHEQTAGVATLKTYGYCIAAGLIVVVCGAAVYGHVLVRRIRHDTWAKAYYLEVLHETEAQSRAIIDTCADGIITIDARGRIETFNPAAEHIFGYGIDEVVGRNVNMLMPSPMREEHDGYIARYLSTREARIIGTRCEVLGQRKDGTTFPMDLTVNVGNMGGLTFFNGIVRDITTRKRAEELQQVRDHFAKFVPEAVKRLVEANPEAPELAKHECDVSVLFLDISGYAHLSERLAPKVLNRLIERYFSTFLDCIHAAGGDINETTGDGFMAIFQDPAPQRHALLAVDAALALLAATATLNADNGDHPPLAVHMGLNSGIALVGSTQLEGLRGTRWTFTASGTVTNLAARLAGMAQPGQILVGPETAQRLGDRYQLQQLRREHLKNVTEAVDVYHILGPATGTW